MILFHILWPTFAMVALIFAVWTVLLVRRMRVVKGIATGAADPDARLFKPIELPGNTVASLFELPVLFFAIVPLLMGTRQAGVAQVLLAWIFVGSRALHSLLHLRRTDVRRQFRVYLASAAVLAAMWIGFFIDFTYAAVAYSRALSHVIGT